MEGGCWVDTFNHDRFCKRLQANGILLGKTEDARKRINTGDRQEKYLGEPRAQLSDMTLDCSNSDSPSDVVNSVEEDRYIL